LTRACALALALVTAALAAGCGVFGGDKDAVEPPAELVPLENTLRVRRLWSAKVGGGSERLRLGLAPATDGARIFAGAHDGKVAAFEAETGRKLWTQDTELPLAAGPGFGGDLLMFGTNDGDLIALDANTGEQRWKVAVGSEVLAAPAVGGNVVVFRTVDGRLRGVTADAGAPLWTVEQSPPALTLRGTTAPKIAGPLTVSGFDNGRIGAYSLATGEPLWEQVVANPTGRNDLQRLADISGGLQIVGNDVYAAGYQGRVVGIDLNTGLVLWQQEMSSFAGLGTDGNRVYVTDEFGAVVALDRRGGTQVWRQEALRLRDVTAPTRFRNAVVVGDFEGYLHWLDPADGHFVARTRAAGDRITSPPLVMGLNLFVQSDDGTVAAFAIVDEEE
jgi:outer membrane protein assembly factor BamB